MNKIIFIFMVSNNLNEFTAFLSDKQNSNYVEDYICYIFMLSGLVILYFAKIQYDISEALRITGFKTKAKVIDVHYTSNETVISVLEFTDDKDNLRKIVKEYEVGNIGEFVDVIYSEDSDEVRVLFFQEFYLIRF